MNFGMPRRSSAAEEPEDQVAISVRLPASLHRRLVKAAAEEDRSINSQITRLIREWLDRAEAPVSEGDN